MPTTPQDRGPKQKSLKHGVCGGVVPINAHPNHDMAGDVVLVPEHSDELHEQSLAQQFPLDRVKLADLRRNAKHLAEQNPASLDAALLAYSAVEDEVTRLLDQSLTQRDGDQTAYFTTQFKEVFEESNKFMAATFTPEYIAKQPWVDLLTDDQARHWQNYEVKEFQLDNKVLRIVGPDVGGSRNGLVAIPESGGYRDLDLDMEFTIKGTVDILFRVAKRVDSTVEFYTLSTKGQEPLRPDQLYTLRVTYIGNILSGSLSPEDAMLPAIESSWTKSRRGALGIQIHPKAELRISRLRVRSLRGC